MYEKTTERALSLSKLVLSLFFLLSSSLRRQSVFRLNKYVVTPKEYKTLFPSPIRVDKKTSQKEARNNRTPNINHESETIRDFFFLLCFFEKKRPNDKNGSHPTFDSSFCVSRDDEMCSLLYHLT